MGAPVVRHQQMSLPPLRNAALASREAGTRERSPALVFVWMLFEAVRDSTGLALDDAIDRLGGTSRARPRSPATAPLPFYGHAFPLTQMTGDEDLNEMRRRVPRLLAPQDDLHNARLAVLELDQKQQLTPARSPAFSVTV